MRNETKSKIKIKKQHKHKENIYIFQNKYNI